MAKSAFVKARMEPKLKQEGEEILHALGLNPTTAITMFYTQMVRQRRFPLELKVPNAETLEAFQEAKNPKYLSKYDSVAKGLDDIWESE